MAADLKRWAILLVAAALALALIGTFLTFALVIAGFLLLAALILIPYAKWRAASRLRALRKTGARTMAAVLEKASADPAQFGGGGRGGKAMNLVAYQFTTDAGEVVQMRRMLDAEPFAALDVAQPAALLYNRDNPQLNRFAVELGEAPEGAPDPTLIDG